MAQNNINIQTALNTVDYKKYLLKFQSLIALLVMSIAIGLLSDKFFTVANGWNVMRQISVNVCISVGMTLVVITAGIDLSVGSILALCGAITASLLKNGIEISALDVFIGFTLLGAVIVGILAGGALGAFNGLAITRFKVPPFVATLAMLTIARGLTMLWTGGFPISGLGKDFAVIGTGWFLGIPVPVWISVVVIIIAIILTNKTKFGRYIYAIGGNENAAKLSGINIKKVKIWVYALAGALSAIGGLLVTSRLDSAQPNACMSSESDQTEA